MRNTPPRARPRVPMPLLKGHEIEVISIKASRSPGWFIADLIIAGVRTTNSFPGKDELDVLGTIMRMAKERSPWD